MKKLIAVLLIPFVLVTTGCSTILHGSSQSVTIESTPTNAKVRFSNGIKGTTPFTTTLSTKREYIIEVKKEGYESAQAQITKNLRGSTIIGNIFFLLIGLAVDISTGAAFELSPDYINVELEKK